MLDINRTRKLRTVTVGLVVFSFIGAQIWGFEKPGNDINTDFWNNKGPFLEIEADDSECTSPRTMHALLYDLSTISVQLSIHEERNGVIISDPIQGLVEELFDVYGDDLCTDFARLSQQQQQLYIEIERLVVELKGLNVKAGHLDENDSEQETTLL